MKIAFYDPIGWDYTPLSPLSRPMGGSQSALCYLAAQLAANGHEIAVVNDIKSPGDYAGVNCPGFEQGGSAEFLNAFDIVIVLNSARGQELRGKGVTTRLNLWGQHAYDQPGVAALEKPEERNAWDGFVMISDWQAETYSQAFSIPRDRMMILHNAISPAMEKAAASPPFYESGDAPVLVYTSTPFRGLDILLLAFPLIRAEVPGCRLKVYSSMGVYNVSDEDDDYRILYELCRAIDGADYVGSIPQEDLAGALDEADILAYPNTFPETSCIAVMEAMAKGCLVVTSDLGALPETTAGHGFLVSNEGDGMAYAHDFAKTVIEVIQNAARDPAAFKQRMEKQLAYAQKSLTWKTRAQEWERWLFTYLQ